MQWYLGRVRTQSFTSLIFVILRCFETFGAMETKNVARVGVEDYHYLCLLIRSIMRIKSLGNYLFFLVHSFFPPVFHCTLVDHHDYVKIKRNVFVIHDALLLSVLSFVS